MPVKNKGGDKSYPPMIISLGPEPLASQRLKRIDGLASQLGVNRSRLIQMIADGKIILQVAPPDPKIAEGE